jgi:ribosome maturation factor RimP
MENEKLDLNTDITPDDDRLISETGTDAKIAAVIGPVIQDLDFRLVRVRMINNNGPVMQIMAERHDGTMSVGDCETISRALSPVLDIEDPIHTAYSLEVSSPGIDRPLVRQSDFENWVGHVAKLETRYLVHNRKRFRGVLIRVDGDDLVLRRDNVAADEEKDAIIPLEAIGEARLILTDDLVRAALKQDKALRIANNLDDTNTGQLDS